MDSKPIYRSAEDIRKVLTWPLVVEAVETALIAVGQAEPKENDAEAAYVNQPQRTKTLAKNEPLKALICMPGFVGNYQLDTQEEEAEKKAGRRDTLACKLMTSFRFNDRQRPPLPNLMANILLFNTNTGRLSAILDGYDITCWGAAAASVVATKYLYFRRFGPDAEKNKIIRVGIIGCGVQGETHALAMCHNFKVNVIYTWNRSMEKSITLAYKLYDLEKVPTSCVCNTPAEVVDKSDVLCVASNSPSALISLQNLDPKKRPVHINAIGSGKFHVGEVDKDIYNQADVYVESMKSVDYEMRDIKSNIVGEIGEVITKAKYPKENGITIFQSMGIAAEDCCVAQAVHEALIAKD